MSGGETRYRPACGSEGADFMDSWCFRCERDRLFREGNGDSCSIAAMTMAVGLDDPLYPKEWQITDRGPHCTAFEPIDPEDQPLDPSAVVRPLI